MAFFTIWIDSQRDWHNGMDEQETDRDILGSSKRLRGMESLHEIIRQVAREPMSQKLTSLQSLAFLTQLKNLRLGELESILEAGSAQISNDDQQVCSWTLIMLSGLVYYRVFLNTLVTDSRAGALFRNFLET